MVGIRPIVVEMNLSPNKNKFQYKNTTAYENVNDILLYLSLINEHNVSKRCVLNIHNAQSQK
jgi:hypothetical protein